MATVALFSPASSPSSWSRISVANLWRCAQRRYRRRSISAQSVASVPPAPALMLTMALRSSYGPEKSSAVRTRSKSAWIALYSASSSAVMSDSSDSVASPNSSRSLERRTSVCHVSISSRRPSASRITFCAARWSDQKSGALASSSSARRRSALASRSKPPRGRVDPLDQIADLGQLHLVGYFGVQLHDVCLDQERADLDDEQRSLAPSDEWVDTRSVSVVRTDSAVSVAVDRHGVAAATALALTRDQVYKWF